MACSGPTAAYFSAPNSARISGPASVGRPALLGAANLAVQPGDSVELESLTLDGPHVGKYTPYVVRLAETGGGIGGMEGDRLASGASFSEVAHPLAGYRLSGADGQAQIVLSFTADHPERIDFDRLTLRFRVNDGGAQEQSFPLGGAVCFDSPRPDRCPEDRDSVVDEHEALADRLDGDQVHGGPFGEDGEDLLGSTAAPARVDSGSNAQTERHLVEVDCRDERPQVVLDRSVASPPLARQVLRGQHLTNGRPEPHPVGLVRKGHPIHGRQDRRLERRRAEPHVPRRHQPMPRWQHGLEAVAQLVDGDAPLEQHVDQLALRPKAGRQRGRERQLGPVSAAAQDGQAAPIERGLPGIDLVALSELEGRGVASEGDSPTLARDGSLTRWVVRDVAGTRRPSGAIVPRHGLC